MSPTHSSAAADATIPDLVSNLAAELDIVKRTQVANHVELMANHAEAMASNAELKEMLKKVIESQDAGRHPQYDSGYSTSARTTSTPSLPEVDCAAASDGDGSDWEDSLDTGWMKPRDPNAPLFRPTDPLPVSEDNSDVAAECSSTQDEATHDPDTTAATQSTLTPSTSDTPECTSTESSALPQIGTTLYADNADTSESGPLDASQEAAPDSSASTITAYPPEPAELISATKAADTMEATEPMDTTDTTATPGITKFTEHVEPAHVFTILHAAIAAADLRVLSAHVAFPKPHAPLPIDNAVGTGRSDDLDRVHEVLSYYITTNNMTKGKIVDDRFVSNLSVTRSLGCAIEHYIAVYAMKDTQAKVGTFIRREMKDENGVSLSGEAIKDLESIVVNWSANILAVENAPAQEVAPQNALTQANIGQAQTVQELPVEMDEDTDSGVQSQQSGNTLQPSMVSQQQHSATITQYVNVAPAIVQPVQPVPSAMTDEDEDKDMLSGEDLHRLRFRPIASRPFHLDCISDQLRSESVLEFARVLEAKTSSWSKWNACRLNEDGLLNMARQVEMGLLSHINRLVQTLERPPSSQQIVEEYTLRRNRKLDEYCSSSAPKLMEKIKKIDQLSVSTMSLTRLSLVHAKVVKQIETKIQNVRTPARRHRDRPPSPSATAVRRRRVTKGTPRNVAVNPGNLQARPTSPNIIAPQQPSVAPSDQSPTNDAALPGDKLAADVLAELQQPSSQTPPGLSVSASVRGETITDFYDTLVDMNTGIPRLALALDADLLAACMDAGVAPFWNTFVELSTDQLIALAKQMEDEALNAFSTKMQGKTWNQTKQEMEYRKAAAKVGPSGTPKGMEKFAERAEEVLKEEEEQEIVMEICDLAFSGLSL